jgi:hypothetical protein
LSGKTVYYNNAYVYSMNMVRLYSHHGKGVILIIFPEGANPYEQQVCMDMEY